jgi:aspartyl-tRNA synthetase
MMLTYSQIDLEMAFADGHDVMNDVEDIFKSAFMSLMHQLVRRRDQNGVLQTLIATHHGISQTRLKEIIEEQRTSEDGNAEGREAERKGSEGSEEEGISIWPHLRKNQFPRITYDTAMRKYGRDKPDLRIPSSVRVYLNPMPRQIKTN